MTVSVAGSAAAPARTAQADAPRARSSTSGASRPIDAKSTRVTVSSSLAARNNGAAADTTRTAVSTIPANKRTRTGRAIVGFETRIAGSRKSAKTGLFQAIPRIHILEDLDLARLVHPGREVHQVDRQRLLQLHDLLVSRMHRGLDFVFRPLGLVREHVFGERNRLFQTDAAMAERAP